MSGPVFTGYLQIFLQCIDSVQLLPGKIQVIPSEMTVSRGLSVDRAAQIQHSDDAGRTQVEVLTDDLHQLFIGYLTGAVCIRVFDSFFIYLFLWTSVYIRL